MSVSASGEGRFSPGPPSSLLVLLVILITRRVIGAEAWPFQKERSLAVWSLVGRLDLIMIEIIFFL